jgi:hypothetical protein
MEEEKDLFEPDGPQWVVLTCYRRQTKEEKILKAPLRISHHELLYGTTVQTRRKGNQGLEALRDMAKFLNKKQLIPRPRIQCAADSPNPDAHIRKHAP